MLVLALALSCTAQTRWWMDEPVRLVQTNLRETDSTLDPVRLIDQIAAFPANTLLLNMGGIVAQYPTKAAFHYASPHLRPGRDLFGEALREAHRRGIRVIGRFDLSKTQKAAYDARPEWFFRKANGEPVVYNDLYSTCINGGYYREHALEILTEALERYEVDGLFFNMFGNQRSDYSGNYVGLCRCESCQRLFRERYGRALPEKPDADYEQFMFTSSREVAASIAELIRRKRPNAAFLTYIHEHVDGIMSESNTAADRPLPLWPYSASDNVERARTSEPSKMAFNLCMSFVDYFWRFATVPPGEISLRLYQNMAHGAGPAFTMHGSPDQEDRSAILAARPVFEWHARHSDLYVGQQNAARVLVVAAGARQTEYRGLFRILSEQHIPFAVTTNTRDLDERAKQYELVIIPDGATAPEAYLRNGGRLLITGASAPALRDLPSPTRRWPTARAAYWRIRDHSLFPSLKDTDVLLIDGEYAEYEGASPLTMILPARFGPPEKVWTDKVESDKPGLLLKEYGKGRLAYVPWSVGALYYRHSSPPHAALIADLIDHLLPRGRQLKTNAHPLVEITVMRQPSRGRTLIHFVNMSGHSQSGYFAPIEMRDIRVEIAGEFTKAHSARLGRTLPLSRSGAYAGFTLPELGAYDVVVLE